MKMKQLLMAGVVFLSLPVGAQAQLAGYTPVTDARLSSPEPQNWLMYRGNYEGWGYSPLKQITDKNVSKLEVAWAYSTGELEGHEAPPIVNNGYMYVATPNNQVIALEAATGRQLWHYKKQIPPELSQLHPTSRGVSWQQALPTHNRRVTRRARRRHRRRTLGQADRRLAGRILLDAGAFDAKGKVLVGASGGEYGIRGFVAAYDPDSGEKLWQTYTVPSPEDFGRRNLATRSLSTRGRFDLDHRLLRQGHRTCLLGHGQCRSLVGGTRPGDNLYTSSVIALDVETGAIKGYHQYHPNDGWDWDEVSAPLLINVKKDGHDQKALVHAGRDGYLWVLGRSKDEISFLNAWPYVTQDVFESVDPKSGRPVYDRTKSPALERPCISARRFGAARIGFPKPIARIPASIMCRPTIIYVRS